MKSNFDDVGDFHEKFGLDNVTHRGVGVREINDALMSFRIKFLYEELKEFEDAYRDCDEVGMFDALIDLVYVALGTAQLRGYPWQAGWNEVQRANMTKVRAATDGSDSLRQSSWDVIKPVGWQPPDIRGVLNAAIASALPPGNFCNRCGRDLATAILREQTTNIPRPHVIIYCPCGTEVGRRNI